MLSNYTLPIGLIYHEPSCKNNSTNVEVKQYQNESLYENIMQHVFSLKRRKQNKSNTKKKMSKNKSNQTRKRTI